MYLHLKMFHIDFFISDIFDYKFYETGSILLNLNKDKKLWSNNILIDFESYINDFIQAVKLVK